MKICAHPVYDMFSENILPSPEAKIQLGISPDQKALLFFGIVREYKGLDTLIQALEHLHSKNIKPTLIVAGEFWLDKPSLLNLIKETKLGDQIVIEDRYILDQEIPIYFSAADVFVAPYKQGTQSGVVKMALGFNLPVVLSQTIVDSTIQKLKDYPVYVTPPDDPIKLAEALESALQELKEDDLPGNEIQENGWQELVNVIEHLVLESSEPDE
jgi:glycosyltransferase involved in cell wall biosynthesis